MDSQVEFVPYATIISYNSTRDNKNIFETITFVVVIKWVTRVQMIMSLLAEMNKL